MMDALQKKVIDCIDEDFIVQFAMALTDVYSPTGAEKAASELVFQKMRSMGLKSRLQEISETRANALGELVGTGGGYTLMFNGHMDISYTEKEVYVPGGDHTSFQQSAGSTGFSRDPSRIEGRWIIGNGIRNMKSAMAAYLGAVQAIQKAQVPLKGDILVAAVAGEIEKARIDDFQGSWLDGYGLGSKHLVTHGGIADMAVIGEPSFLKISRGNMGAVWAKIGIRGDYTHTAWCDEVVNPIFRMMKVIEALQKWIPDYQGRYSYLGAKPQVNMSAIQGGWPWRLSRTPGYCYLYVDVRIIPGQHPITVKEELAGIIREQRQKDPDMDIDFEILVTDPATVIDEDEAIVASVKKAHAEVFGKPPEEYFDIPVSDAIHLNRYGVPSLTYGPAGRAYPGKAGFSYGSQNIDDLIECTKVYALTALDICSRTK
jgi:acetylornithine deacetylase